MKKTFRVTALVICFHLAGMLQACKIDCGCEPAITRVTDYKAVTLSNLDNSGTCPVQSSFNEMPAGAVAFAAALSNCFDNVCRHSRPGMAFSVAWACDCPPPLLTFNQQVTGISVLTLRPLQGAPAGTEVTERFLAQPQGPEFRQCGGDFRDVDDLPASLNGLQFGSGDLPGFYLFAKETLQADSVQFVVNLSLSDGRVLADTTNVIALR